MNNQWLTQTLPGTGGEIKVDAEDFRVDEIPLYQPCGSGEHLFVEIEKTGLSTFSVIEQLARQLKIKPRDIGYAGLKDAKAITRQSLSLPGVKVEDLDRVEIEGVRVLNAVSHQNKLRPGHLAGNRFHIKIRNTAADAEEKALDILYVLQDIGVPNRFGEQRYGSLANNQLVGKAILAGDFDEAINQIIGSPEQIRNERWKQAATAWQCGEREEALNLFPPRFRSERQLIEQLLKGRSAKEAVLRLQKRLLRLYLSAWQSSLFDRVVQMRLDSLATLWPGDIAYIHANGACFDVEDENLEQPRVDTFEISPSGPMFGHKIKMATKQCGILEQAILDKELPLAFTYKPAPGIGLQGERRPLRVPLTDAACRTIENGIQLTFSLPKGSFATTVLAEVIKPEKNSNLGV